MTKQDWAGTTYGNGWMHRWLKRMLRVLDVRILYVFSALFVIPVCLLVNPSRRVIYRYFRNRIGYGRFKAMWKTYVNHCLFAQVVIDKFAMYAGRQFSVKEEGLEHFDMLASQTDGFVQLSSHVGNYEIAGYTLVSDKKPMNALVYFGEKASVMQNRSDMFSRTNIHMIAIKSDKSHLFAINDALQRNEIVSMPADRINGSPRYVEKDFLGGKARFPLGPFSVATMRNLDVLSVNVIKTSLTEYTFFIKPLKYDKSTDRKKQIAQLSDAYVAELERILQRYPEQWYNFFEFWQ